MVSPSPLADDLTFLSPQLPRLWVGYALAALLFVLEVVAGFQNPSAPEKAPVILWFLGVALAAGLYWLYCVYKYHDIMTQVPGWDHPVSAGRAVGLHFIPFYNFYWIYKWPTELARFVNWRAQSDIMSPAVAGTLMLAAFLVRIFDNAIGLALIFGAGTYISNRMRRAFAVPAPASPSRAPFSQLGL